MSELPLAVLLDKFFDDALTPAERADLAQRLASNPTAAEAFARAARLNAGLASHFSQAAAIERQRALLAQITAGVAPASRPRGRIRPIWIAAAATLLVAIGLGWLIFSRWQPARFSPLPGENRIVAGRVRVAGQPAVNITASALPTETSLEVADDQPAMLRLADGSRAELEPKSLAVLHEPAGGARQIVELKRGAGTFRVERGRGEFQVHTPAGRVTALGTEFTVNVLPSFRSGESEMRAKSLLLVAVLSGLVQVDVGGVIHRLAGGDSFLFAEEGGKQPAVRGLVVAIDAAAGSVTLDGVKKEGKEVSPPQKYAIASDAKVTIAGQSKTLADVKAGDRVQLSLAADKQTVVALEVGAAQKENREKETGKRVRNVTGQVSKTEGSQLVIVIRGDSGERTETYSLDAETKIQMQTADDEIVKGEGGSERKTPKLAEGTISDLKSGDRVTVSATEAGKADRVLKLRPPVKKEGGEGK